MQSAAGAAPAPSAPQLTLFAVPAALPASVENR